MNEQTLIRDMKQSVGGSSFMTLSELMAYLGFKTYPSVRPYVKGLQVLNSTKYFIPEIAENLISRMEGKD